MITGSIVALVTPMLENGEIDWLALEALVEYHIAAGTHAISPVGTTGESATLDVAEHTAVIAKVVEQVAGRVPVIAGTGANSTAEAIELTRSAKSLGVDACLIVTPYYNKPTQAGLLAHFQAIAAAVDVDIVLYNVPGRTACDMTNDTVVALSKIANIIGLKDATGDVVRGADLISRVDPDFAVYSGDDGTALELILAGGKGDISVTANVAATGMSKMISFALAGDIESAKALNAKLQGLHDNLFIEANPIPVKWALAEQGKIQAGIRLPLTPLAEEYQAPLKQALNTLDAELI